MEKDNAWGKYLLRSNGVGRIILGAALTLALTLSPNQAQAGSRASLSIADPPVQGLMASYLLPDGRERYPKTSHFSETLTRKVISPWAGRFLTAPLSPLSPFYPLPRLTSPVNIVSPPAARPFSRSEPGNLTDRVLTQARHYIGAPYRRGASLQTGHATDCSGFVQFIYKKANIDLPRSSPEQARVGMVVTHTMQFAKMLPGDLLFFGHRGHRIGHAGIYLGDGKMIHASSRRQGVIITDLRQSSYDGAFVVARRVFEAQSPK